MSSRVAAGAPGQCTVKQQLRTYYDALVAESLEARSLQAGGTAGAILSPAPARAYFQQRKLSEALRLGGFQPGQDLLEVGCSAGYYTFLLAAMGYRVAGVDLSPRSVDVARRLADRLGMRGVTFHEADFERLDAVPDASVDGVVSFSTIRYVPDPLAALRQAARVVRPSGRVVIDFPNRYCPWFKYLKTWCGVNVHPHDRHYSARDAEQLFRQAGFEEVRSVKILFTPTITPRSLLPVMRVVDTFAERLPLIRETAAIIMCVGRKPLAF